MEDLLEEIVGEIRDEHDEDEQEPIHDRLAEKSRRRSGHQHRGRERKTRHDALPTEDFETIGGYMVGLFGRLPREGEEIEADRRTRLKVERTRGRRILSVRIFTSPNGVGSQRRRRPAR